MSEESVNRAIRQRWRELGFFYDLDHHTKAWRLVGSRAGLLRFREALSNYAEDPENDYPSEHEHFGPYMYLEVMTWPNAGFDAHSIHGSLPDLRRLASIIGAKIENARPGEVIQIREEFAANSPYSMVLEVTDDDFDPAGADPALPKEAG